MAERRDYGEGRLTEAEAGTDPFALFTTWHDVALSAGLFEPTAAAVATVDGSGHPSCRVVLLKGFDARGFVFFTNRESRKGRDLDANPRAAMTLWWDKLVRQVRIEGAVERVSDAESDAYHATRPRGSQLAAWASAQSAPLADRAALEKRYAELEAKYSDREIPRPPHWGGYRLIPETIEFWQGRRDRLHDRIVFVRVDGGWKRERLFP